MDDQLKLLLHLLKNLIIRYFSHFYQVFLSDKEQSDLKQRVKAVYNRVKTMIMKSLEYYKISRAMLTDRVIDDRVNSLPPEVRNRLSICWNRERRSGNEDNRESKEEVLEEPYYQTSRDYSPKALADKESQERLVVLREYVKAEAIEHTKLTQCKTEREAIQQYFPWHSEVAAILRWIWKLADGLDRETVVFSPSVTYRVLGWRVSLVFDWILRHCSPRRRSEAGYAPYYDSQHMAFLEYYLIQIKPSSLAVVMFNLAMRDIATNRDRAQGVFNASAVNRHLGRQATYNYGEEECIRVLEEGFKLGTREVLKSTHRDLVSIAELVNKKDQCRLTYSTSFSPDYIRNRYPFLQQQSIFCLERLHW